jgi:hypothetical protein
MNPGTAPDGRISDANPGGFFQRHGIKLVVSVVLGGGIAWVMARGGLPLVPPKSTFAELRPWTVPAYLLTLVVVHFFRAVRWRHLLRAVGQVSLRSVISVSWIAFGAILISPLRSGEVVRPYLITKRSSIKLWEATGTIGAERVIDGLLLSILLFLGLQLSTPLNPLPDHVGKLRVPAAAVPGAAYTALTIFLVAFIVMGIFFFARDFARRVTFAVGRVISQKLASRLAGIVERIADGLRFLPSPSHVVPFMAETLAYWFINALGVWLLGWGCGLTGMTLAQATVTMGCLGIGILVPSGPGYFGAFQLSTYMALAMFFHEDALTGAGAAFVFLLYATQVGFHLVAMGVGMLMDRSPHLPELTAEVKLETTPSAAQAAPEAR